VYQQDIIEALTKWTSGIRITGFFMVGILILMSLLNMIIVISMKVASKRQEIATVRLLGATSWFINGPFLFEGAIYGLIGAVIAWGITYISLLYATPVLVDFFGDIPVLPIDPVFMLTILGGMVLGAVSLGMISGAVSAKRFEQ
jgi:cell division transport system permease protein